MFTTNATTTSGFPLSLSLVQEEQHKELSEQGSKLKTNLEDIQSEFHKQQELDDAKIIFYRNNIYVPKTLRKHTIDLYHYYLNHPGGDRLANTLQEVCYWKGMVNRAKPSAGHCQSYQKFKCRAIRYGHHLPPMNIARLQQWNTVHIDLLIGPYRKTVKQHQPGNTIKEVDLHYLTCMTFIDPSTRWLEIAQVPYFDMDNVKTGDTEYIDKTSARISQLFNNTWLSRYLRLTRVVLFDNGSEFSIRQDFIPLLKDADVKPVLTSMKSPQSNAPVEHVHQVLHNMILTKNLNGHILDYINPWGEMGSASLASLNI